MIFTMALFINMILDLFSRDQPNIVSKLEFTPDPSVIILINFKVSHTYLLLITLSLELWSQQLMAFQLLMVTKLIFAQK